MVCFLWHWVVKSVLENSVRFVFCEIKLSNQCWKIMWDLCFVVLSGQISIMEEYEVLFVVALRGQINIGEECEALFVVALRRQISIEDECEIYLLWHWVVKSMLTNSVRLVFCEIKLSNLIWGLFCDIEWSNQHWEWVWGLFVMALRCQISIEEECEICFLWYWVVKSILGKSVRFVYCSIKWSDEC